MIFLKPGGARIFFLISREAMTSCEIGKFNIVQSIFIDYMPHAYVISYESYVIYSSTLRVSHGRFGLAEL